MAIEKFYSKRNHSISIVVGTLTAFTVQGINGDEDAIVLAYPDSISTVTPGLNSVALSIGFNPTAELSIKLNPVSTSIDAFKAINLAQQTGNASDITIIIQAGNGEKTILSGCALSGLGELSTGGDIGPIRTVKFVCSKALDDII